MCAAAYGRYTYKQPIGLASIRGSYGKNGIADEEQPRYDRGRNNPLRDLSHGCFPRIFRVAGRTPGHLATLLERARMGMGIRGIAMTAQARDLIMWVGSGPYPTWRAFADEAHAMGVCKRVRAVPRGIVVGQSKCYLLHGERLATEIPVRVHMFHKKTGVCRFCGISRDKYSESLVECNEHMVRRAGKPHKFLYGYFVIDDVLIVTSDTETQNKYMKAYPTMDFCFKSWEAAAAVPDRSCGSLKGEAIYLRGPLTEYPEPKRWLSDSYVGFRYYMEVA